MRNPVSSKASTSTTTTTTTNKTTPCCSKVGLKRGPWTPEEDELLANYIRREGEGRWSLIAGRIPGRTDNEIKNYWNTHLSKKLVNQGIDPRTHKPLDHTNVQPLLAPADPNASSSSKTNPKLPIHNNNNNPLNLGLEEEPMINGNSSSTPMLIINNHHMTSSLDQYHHAIDHRGNGGSSGYTNLLVTCDNSGGLMSLRGIGGGSHDHHQEDDQDINYCGDDVFSSFLNSLINEDAFANQHHQVIQLQQQSISNNNMQPSSSDPLIPIGATLKNFGLDGANTWEPLISSSTNALSQINHNQE
ncbi:hypothetical protein ACFE04_015352 [Oxalis oulophora]